MPNKAENMNRKRLIKTLEQEYAGVEKDPCKNDGWLLMIDHIIVRLERGHWPEEIIKDCREAAFGYPDPTEEQIGQQTAVEYFEEEYQKEQAETLDKDRVDRVKSRIQKYAQRQAKTKTGRTGRWKRNGKSRS